MLRERRAQAETLRLEPAQSRAVAAEGAAAGVQGLQDRAIGLLFTALDRDGDGVITNDELRKALSPQSRPPLR